MKKNDNARDDLGNSNSKREIFRRLLNASLERNRNLLTNSSSRETEVSSLATPFATQHRRMRPAEQFMPWTHFGSSTSDSLAGAAQSPLGASEAEPSSAFLVPHEASEGFNCRTDDNQPSPCNNCSNRKEGPREILKNFLKKKGIEKSEIFRGRNLSHLNSESIPQISAERYVCEAASQMAKDTGELKRTPAVATQTDDSCGIQTPTNSTSLGCVDGTESAPVAETSGVQNQSRRNRKEKRLVCDKCEQDFDQKSSLEVHQGIHTGEKPFGCSTCSKGFTQKGNLMTHLLTHKGEKPFACEVCGKGFTQKSTLTEHLLTHTGERPFACEFCGEKFSRKSTLRDHRRIHTGEKPHVCHICNKAFRTKTHLNAHIQTHK